MLFGPLVQ
ncbi:Protein of unknown function [Propionibacterium freudenreichii subsp. freudenreichii]|nr:Protein of unknown function [Propionibacterium freudenreichii subsp. freudenreichii]